MDIDDGRLESALAVAEAVGDRKGLHGVAAAVREVAEEPDDPLRGLVAGLEYHLTFDSDARDRHGPFGPMMEFDGKAYPAPLSVISDLDPGIFELWDRALSYANAPAVRARLADLLWEARYGERPDRHARQAVGGYVEAIDDDLQHPVDIGDGVRRAIEIASQLNDHDLRLSAVAAGVRLARRAMNMSDPMPGVALRLLELFASDRPDRRPVELPELLDLADDRFGQDPWHLESLASITSPIIDDDDKPGVWARAAEAFVALSDESSGLARLAHLRHALEIAEQHGLREMSARLRTVIEAMSDEDLELHEVSAEVKIPNQKIEAFVDQFVGDDHMEAALSRFGSYLTNSDIEGNREHVQQLMRDHPLQFLVTRVILGPENTVARSPAAGDDVAEQELIRHEAAGLGLFAHFAVDILNRIRDRYGPIADAAAFFENDFVSSELAEAFARGVRLYEQGEFDAAASVLAPRLETAIRRLAGVVGLPVTKAIDTHGRATQVKGLGQLLKELEGALPEATRRHLRVLLSDPIGLNLRNTVGHGFADRLGRREAALLLHAACHISLLTPTQVGEAY